MASRVVKVTGKTLVDNWDEVKKMLDLVSSVILSFRRCVLSLIYYKTD